MSNKHKHTFEPCLIETDLIFPKKKITYLYLGEKCKECDNYRVTDYFSIRDSKKNLSFRTMTNEEIRAKYPDLPIIKRRWA